MEMKGLYKEELNEYGFFHGMTGFAIQKRSGKVKRKCYYCYRYIDLERIGIVHNPYSGISAWMCRACERMA